MNNAPITVPAQPAGGGVLVAIVNYRTAPLAVACLRSLRPEVAACPGTRVVVVDNCSGDGSAEAIERAIAAEGWSSWASLQRAAVNGGFSYGNNCAIRPALAGPRPPEHVWLLNPDTEVRPGALRELLAFMAAHPAAGIVGSSFEHPDGRVWPHAFRFPSLSSEFAAGLRLDVVARLLARRTVLLTMGERAERVDWLPGSSLLIRRAVFDDVGLLDEGYFLYFEETDFCLQAARAGWECWYVPASRVMHHAGQSTGVSGARANANRRPDYWFESRRRYWIKNHGWAYAALTDFVFLLAFAAWQVRRVLQRKAEASPPHFLRDLLRHSALFHAALPVNPRVGKTATREAPRGLESGEAGPRRAIGN